MPSTQNFDDKGESDAHQNTIRRYSIILNNDLKDDSDECNDSEFDDN